MRARDACATAVSSIFRNALRSSLATVGIVISVVAVVCTAAVGDGARARLADDLAGLGSNLVFVSSGSSRSHRARAEAQTAAEKPIALADVEAMAAELGYLSRAVAPLVQLSGQAVLGSNNCQTQLMGTWPAYQEARHWQLAGGRFITAADNAQAAKVCVIGATVAEKLFADTDPLGATFRMRGMPCTVVGVFVKKGHSGFGQNQDDMVLMPLNSLTRRVVPMDRSLGLYAMAAAAEPQWSATLEAEMRALMRQRHRLATDTADDFSLFNLAEVQQSAASQMRTVSVLLNCVAGIALVVGAIGIANVMLVSVTERTREIGLRLAIGARRRDILWQFLLEAVVLSASGGVLGLAVGSGLAKGAAQAAGWQVSLAAGPALIALAAAAAAGVGAGLYPAYRASRLDPIAALRAD